MLAKHFQFRRAIYAGLLGLASCLTGAAMDQARVETRVDEAAARFGVTGKGVVVAIMDRGIDWRNNDFRNADGTTRIAWLYDLTDDSGSTAPGNPYGIGTLYSRQQLNDALTYGTNLVTRDAVGHGTSTAGIAAGGGRNVWKYRGIAYDATLLIVKFVAEDVPAHDNQPPETAFYDPSRLPTALQFIKNKSQALGMPWVALLNIGSVGGPMDGSSSWSKLIDSTVGPGLEGRVFVNGSSDDGNMPNHAATTVTQDGDTVLQIHKGNSGDTICDLWYPATDDFDVSIETPNSLSGPFLSPFSNDGYAAESSSEFVYYHYGANVTPYGATRRREIYLGLTGPTGDYAVTLHGASVVNGHFDASLNPSRFWDTSANSNYFTSFAVPGYTVCDFGSSSNSICPGDYVHRTNWTDIDGIFRYLGGQGNLGDLWLGSGTGPTWDGRTGIDVTTPGDSVFATYNTNSWWATSRFNLVQDGAGLYGRASAVSAANPLMTGIVALMLQMNPQLDAIQVKHILQQSARADSFTGAVPNPRWGYGKVDAYQALALVQNTLPSLGISVTNQQATITVQRATPGRQYELYRSPDLRNWASLVTNTAPNATFTFSDPTGSIGTKFYRVARLP
jgi:minor extracellular serine protease Vpr